MVILQASENLIYGGESLLLLAFPLDRYIRRPTYQMGKPWHACCG